jgi:hypothetical protein
MLSESDDELRVIYGDDAVISRKRQFVFIHVDNPSPELIEEREGFKPDDLFAAGCRWVSVSRQNVIIVYMERSVQQVG